MCTGIFKSKINNTGRTILPTILRDYFVKTLMDNRAIITNSIPVDTNNGKYYSGLSMFSCQKWEYIKIQIEDAKYIENQYDSIKQTILGPATQLVIDKRGQIQIPELLCRYGNINFRQEVVFACWIDRFDLWSMEVWDIIEPIVMAKYGVLANEPA